MKSETLLKHFKSIEFGTEKSGPFCQISAINTVISRYKIPAVAWGYKFDIIGVKTLKQAMLWRDRGYELVFLGIVNLADMSTDIPSDDKKKGKIQLFGELELDLAESRQRIYKDAFKISEACGYSIREEGDLIIIEGTDLERVEIKFQGSKAVSYTKIQYSDIGMELQEIEREEIKLA